MRVTVGVLETLLTAFDPVAVEPLEPQAARPAVSAATLAIVMRVRLDMRVLLLVYR
jgi:hypothetical protein